MVGIEKSRAQGWTELADGTQDGTASDGRLDNLLVWEELKKRDTGVFRDVSEDELKLRGVIAEGGQAQILEASLKDNDEKLMAKVFKMEGFSLAELKRQSVTGLLQSGWLFLLWVKLFFMKFH